ncbi:MAG: TolC family protein [Candidatus Omnitrophica bacterium]|nr:TolC family protein [Candidatus Omnitrophota bacterium]
MIIFKRTILFLSLIVFFSGALFAQEEHNNSKALSLDDCIVQALQAHPKLKIYEQKIDQTKESLNGVMAQNLPQVNIAASYDRLSYVSQSKQRYLGSSQNDYQADIVVTQPLFSGGRIASQKKAAQLTIDAVSQGYFAAREAVVFEVKAAYFKLIFTKDILRSKEALLKYVQDSYDTALELNKRTKIPREETLLRLEVQLNDTRQELISAQDSLKIAQKILLNTMGLDSSDSIEVQDLKDDILSSKYKSKTVEGNFELLKLSKEIKEADELIEIEKSGFYPQINALYSYGYEWAEISEGDTDWIAGVKVDFNVWDWGKTRAAVRQAKAYKGELQSYAALLSQQIGLDLESAWLKYKSALSKLEIVKTSCERAKRSLDLFSSRYQDSLVSSLELLDAQKAFSQAQINCALTKLDMRVAKAEIEKIEGKGYDAK